MDPVIATQNMEMYSYGAKSCGVAHGNRFVSAKSNLKSGNYFTVSNRGSVNRGSKKYRL